MGPDVQSLEEEIAAFLGVEHAVACNSGTDALVLSLRALGIGPGHQVITSAFSFFATAEAISMVGANPIFADIDPRTFNLDPASVAERITPRTAAILPVHLYGQSADLTPIMVLADAHNLRIVEDAAQAFGGRYRGRKSGTLGDASAFSFFPSKNLGAFGDAGLLTLHNAVEAEHARMLRTHGSRRKYANEMLGYNSRMDTIQAAILRVKLPHVEEWNEARRRAAAHYDDLLADVPLVATPYVSPDAYHVYHQYTIRIGGGRRDAVQKSLASAHIDSMVYYPTPIHKLPVYSEAGVSLPQTEAAAGEVLSLPIWPDISH